MPIVKVTQEMLDKAISDVDWEKQDALTDEDIARAVASDPDESPLWTAAELDRAMARSVRKTLGLSQVAFAARFRIPLGTLRDWEQARKRPDATALTYLKVIARNPDMVLEALDRGRK